MTIWLNGELREAEGAISAEDRGFLIGDGAFETILTDRGDPIFLAPHLARLATGLAAIGIAAPLDSPLVRQACRDLAARNRIEGAGVLRITVSRGNAGRVAGVSANAMPTRLMSLGKFGAPPAELTAILARQRRFAAASTAAFKSIAGYADNLAALDEARAQGADEALMLNECGRLAGASVANVFLISAAGSVATPPVADGALPGVVRAFLISGVPEHGVRIEERPVSVTELERASVFVTNSLRGLRRIAGRWPQSALAVFSRLESWYLSRLAVERETAGSSP